MQPVSPTDFSHQDCRNRSFRCQDLSYANFQGADLRGADLSEACLIGANFTEARFGQTQRQKLCRIILGGVVFLICPSLLILFDAAQSPFIIGIILFLFPILIRLVQPAFPNMFEVLGRVSYFIFLAMWTLMMVFLVAFNIVLAIAFFAVWVWFVQNLKFAPIEVIPPTGTRFCDANLSQAIFCSTSAQTKLKNIDFSGAILANVDFTNAWLIDIKGTHYFRDIERHDIHPAEGQFTPLEMLDALEQMKDADKTIHRAGD